MAAALGSLASAAALAGPGHDDLTASHVAAATGASADSNTISAADTPFMPPTMLATLSLALRTVLLAPLVAIVIFAGAKVSSDARAQRVLRTWLIFGLTTLIRGAKLVARGYHLAQAAPEAQKIRVALALSAALTAASLISLFGLRVLALTGAAIACAAYAAAIVARKVKREGLATYMSPAARQMLRETTLLEWLRDDSLSRKIAPLRPFLLGMSDDEVRLYLHAAPSHLRTTLLQPGLARALPDGLKALLLGNEADTIAAGVQEHERSAAAEAPAASEHPHSSLGGGFPEATAQQTEHQENAHADVNGEIVGAIPVPYSRVYAAVMAAGEDSSDDSEPEGARAALGAAPHGGDASLAGHAVRPVTWPSDVMSAIVRRRVASNVRNALAAAGLSADALLDLSVAASVLNAAQLLIWRGQLSGVGRSARRTALVANLGLWLLYLARRRADAALSQPLQGAHGRGASAVALLTLLRSMRSRTAPPAGASTTDDACNHAGSAAATRRGGVSQRNAQAAVSRVAMRLFSAPSPAGDHSMASASSGTLSDADSSEVADDAAAAPQPRIAVTSAAAASGAVREAVRAHRGYRASTPLAALLAQALPPRWVTKPWAVQVLRYVDAAMTAAQAKPAITAAISFLVVLLILRRLLLARHLVAQARR